MRVELTGDTKANLRLIRQVINDAMSTKDKYVTINMLGGNFTSINVYPISEDTAHWVEVPKETGGFRYVCSECGFEGKWPTTYCPSCGEKLKVLMREVSNA